MFSWWPLKGLLDVRNRKSVRYFSRSHRRQPSIYLNYVFQILLFHIRHYCNMNLFFFFITIKKSRLYKSIIFFKTEKMWAYLNRWQHVQQGRQMWFMYESWLWKQSFLQGLIISERGFYASLIILKENIQLERSHLSGHDSCNSAFPKVLSFWWKWSCFILL